MGGAAALPAARAWLLPGVTPAAGRALPGFLAAYIKAFGPDHLVGSARSLQPLLRLHQGLRAIPHGELPQGRSGLLHMLGPLQSASCWAAVGILSRQHPGALQGRQTAQSLLREAQAKRTRVDEVTRFTMNCRAREEALDVGQTPIRTPTSVRAVRAEGKELFRLHVTRHLPLGAVRALGVAVGRSLLFSLFNSNKMAAALSPKASEQLSEASSCRSGGSGEISNPSTSGRMPT